MIDTSQTAAVPIGGRAARESGTSSSRARDYWDSGEVGVLVLSDDEELLATLREAGGQRYPVTAVSSWEALRSAVPEKDCGVVLLDTDTVSGALEGRLEELVGLDPAIVVLVASKREQADRLMSLLAERKIHRLLIKPPAVGITSVLLDSSVGRCIELRQRHRQRPEIPLKAPVDRRRMIKPRRLGTWLVAAGVVAGSLGAAIWINWANGPETPPVVVRLPGDREPPVTDAQTSAGGVGAAGRAAAAPVADAAEAAATEAAQAGEAADAADAGDPGDAALAASAAAEPAAEEGAAPGTTAGPEQAEPVAAAAPPPEPQPADRAPDTAELGDLFAAAETALIAGDLDEAADRLLEIETVEPDSSRLAFLRAQLEREQAAEAAAEPEPAAAPSELTSLIGLARARLDQGRLTSPAADNALEYFESARAIDAQDPAVQALAADLGPAVLTEAEIALANAQFAQAEVLFAAAERLGVSDEDLVALELSLVYARDSLAQAERDELLAEARTRIAAGRLFEPAGESALDVLLEVQGQDAEHPGLAAAFAELRQALQAVAEEALAAGDWDAAADAIEALSRSGAPVGQLGTLRDELTFGRTQEAYLAQAAPASELNVVEFEPPVYPARALTRGVEGWVDLEFVVGRDGVPRDIVVTAAEPEGEFEAAAREAAATYVYEPFALNGHRYERRVSLRMRFALQ